MKLQTVYILKNNVTAFIDGTSVMFPSLDSTKHTLPEVYSINYLQALYHKLTKRG